MNEANEEKMDCTDMANKYGIKQYLLDIFSEECMKFYSQNDKELIELQAMPAFDLVRAGYGFDMDDKYYEATKKTITCNLNGKKFEVFEYKDCFIYYVFLCNSKSKKYRYISMEDVKGFQEDAVYVYKDKYYCQYYKALKSLIFFNKNVYINLPGISVISELKKANSKEFVSKYFSIEDNKGYNNPNILEFEIADDEAIIVHFNIIYKTIMRKIFEKENPTYYKNVIEKNETDIDTWEFLDDFGKNAYKIYYLFGDDKFRNFCNNICEPEYFKHELLKNGEVRKNLKNNFWIYNEFNSTLRNPDDDFIQGEDFTFLIINAIKALEYLLYRKIKKYEEFKKIDNDNQISEKTMLDNLIYFIQNHKEMFKTLSEDIISKNNYEIYIKEYIDLLYYVKDECRNGYFHKERIDGYDSLCEKREKVLEAIAKTIILLK